MVIIAKCLSVRAIRRIVIFFKIVFILVFCHLAPLVFDSVLYNVISKWSTNGSQVGESIGLFEIKRKLK